MIKDHLICPECGVTHDDACPECGRELYRGYGLMGGGIGAYATCDCGYFDKRQDTGDDPEAVTR